MLVVSKFGGTSMGDAAAMKKSAEVCLEHHSSVVVVSANSGTTDRLIEIAKAASKGELELCDTIIFNLKERHTSLLKQVAPMSEEAASLLQQNFTELDLLVQNLTLLKELTPRAYDHMLSLGERISSLIFREVLRKEAPHKEIVLLDARSVLKTDSHFGQAAPLIDLMASECKNKMTITENKIYVTQGFIGSDIQGNTTILGRGGSDYSAALFAEALDATCLEIWTDVPGIATTDPRICKEAKIIPELAYQEAGEMAQYGAKILHPATISPAVRKSIPVFVGSTFAKDEPGTWIRRTVEFRPPVRAITKRSAQGLVTVTTPNMYNASGFMGSIFDIFAKHRVSVDCVTTSEISVAITVDHATLENIKFIEDLKKVGNLEIEKGFSLISLIGNELYRRSNLAKTIFGTMDEAKIRMMSLGASPYNFNFLVKEDEANICIQKLHQTLIEAIR